MTEAIAPSTVATRSRTDLILSIGRKVHSPQMSTGALAELRRGTRFDVALQAAFHGVISDVPESWLRVEYLPRWAAIAQCIALTYAPARRSDPDGAALASADLSETRFSRLLVSRGNGFFDQLLLVARYMRAKDAPLDWIDLGILALTTDVHEDRADATRLRLARDFYRVQTSVRSS